MIAEIATPRLCRGPSRPIPGDHRRAARSIAGPAPTVGTAGRPADAVRAAVVLVQPLSQHRVAPGPPVLVLGWGAQTPDRIRHGIARLVATLSAAR